MKFAPYVSLLLLLSSLCGVGQVNLKQGLIAYYPFNGNTDDASGNGNHAVFNNATPTADRFGNANGAYRFNGVDNYMRETNSTSFNPTRISIVAMVKVYGIR